MSYPYDPYPPLFIPALAEREMNYEEQEVARHLLGHYNYAGGWKGGSFTTRLIELLESADQTNKERLYQGFPAMRYPVYIMQTQGGPALQRALGLDEKEIHD